MGQTEEPGEAGLPVVPDIAHARAPQVGATQVRTAQVGIAQVGPGEDGAAEIGTAQVGADEVSGGEVRVPQVRALEVGAGQGRGIESQEQRARRFVFYFDHADGGELG